MRNTAFADTFADSFAADSDPGFYPDVDPDVDPDVAAIDEAINPPRIPDREVIAAGYDARGQLLPLYRVWLVDGYTLIVHAATPGEAYAKAIDDAKAMIERTGLDRKMTARQRRQATTVRCYQQLM